MRVGAAVRTVLAVTALALLAPSVALGHDGLDTAAGHHAEDSGTHDAAAEPAMAARTQRATQRDAQVAAAAVAGDEHVVGRWGPLVDWPVVGIHVALLPNGKVLAWDSVGDNTPETYPVHDHTRATVWDPETGTQTPVWVNNWNLFCAGLAHLPDGSLFLAGGNRDAQLGGINKTHVFNHTTNAWSVGPDMAVDRWYPSVTPLRNGEMLITGGRPSLHEVRTTSGSLRALSTAMLGLPLYPWLDVAPDGRAFYSGPDPTMRSLNPEGTGAWQTHAQRDNIDRGYGSRALYDVGKILVAGGGASSNDSRVIDINGASPQVSRTASMASGRRQHNLTVLADGSVLATGGNSSGADLVDLGNGVYAAERWDPATATWSTLAAEQVTRQYHSTALLLPDGRVLSSGGGVCDDCDAVGYLSKNAQVFTPPYLFKRDGSGDLAPRPVIANAPATAKHATSFQIDTPQAASIRKVALIRIGAVTHSVNMEQRYVPLAFTASAGALTATAPGNANVAPPGVYMLVILDADGVPSVARMVRITGNSEPSVALTQPPSGATFGAPASIELAATASDPDGSVAKVEFFNGATKLGEDTTAPYTVSWTGVQAGGYSLTARATDDLGAQTTSAASTVTVTGSGTASTFGNTAIGTASEPAGGGYKFGSVYTLNETGTATSFGMYVRGGGSLQRFTPVVYRTDALGLPTALVVTGTEVTIAAGQAPGWVTSPLPATSLTAGRYLVGLMAGPNGAQAANYYDPVSNGGFWNASPYGTAPTNWGAVNRENSAYSFYVNYTPATTGPAPANTAPPSVTGTAVAGRQLTASTGTWSGSPTSWAYQWRRCDAGGANCSDIPAAAAATYTLAGADVGGTIRVVVTATNGGGSTPATSAATAVIAPAPPTSTAAPVVSGTAMSGRVLSTTNGTWTGSPTSFAYQWRRCDSGGGACTDIAGAAATTYTLTMADAGATIRVAVTARNAGGQATATSDPTAVIAPAAPTNSTRPVITGNAVTGNTLTASDGTWTGSPTGYTRQWQRCDAAGQSCADVDGATSAGYVPDDGDIGSTLRIVVTASNVTGSTVATSDATTVVRAAPPANTGLPLISGTAMNGRDLTATDGTWTGDPTSFAHKWRRCDASGGACADIAGATSPTYTLTGADVGRTLRVAVTATGAGGSAMATSDASAVVAAASSPPSNTAPPTVTGAAVTGQTLTATLGTWAGHPAPQLAAQWQACQSSTCADIATAQGTTYVVSAADLGKTLRVVVTATNASGTAAAPSAQTQPVTAAPTPAGTSFGMTAPGASVDQSDEGYKFAGVHLLRDEAKLVDFRFYARGGTWTQSFVPAIYTTNASRPKKLIAKGATVTVAANSPAAWRTSVLPAAMTLQPGEYALALLAGPSGRGAFIYFDVVAGEASWRNYNGWPNPATSWGALSSSPATQWSFHVTYDATVPAGI